MENAFFLPVLAAKVFVGIFVLLGVATLVGKYAAKKNPNNLVKELNIRVNAWWGIVVMLLAAFWFGREGMIVLFMLLSFATLREFMTHVYRYRADHNRIALCFYVLLPMQYYFVWTGWYSMFTVLIPVYAFLLLPIAGHLAGETQHFFERTAKIQWGVMITVYCLSHVPALMTLPLKDFAGQNILLLLFMLVVVQGCDVLYYLWRRTGGLTGGRRKDVGAMLSVSVCTILAASLYWITPFTPFQAALIGLLMSVMGFFGGEVMRLIKHSFGIRHWGQSSHRYTNVLDRVDSLCFAAPVFFHIVRYYWT